MERTLVNFVNQMLSTKFTQPNPSPQLIFLVNVDKNFMLPRSYWHGAAKRDLPDSVTEWGLLVSSQISRDDKTQRQGILWNKRVLNYFHL